MQLGVKNYSMKSKKYNLKSDKEMSLKKSISPPKRRTQSLLKGALKDYQRMDIHVSEKDRKLSQIPLKLKKLTSSPTRTMKNFICEMAPNVGPRYEKCFDSVKSK